MATLNRTFSVKNGIDVANTVIIDTNRNLTNVGNVTPTGNNAQSLGTPSARFKDLYLSNSTIFLGEAGLSASGDELRANSFNAAVSFVSGGLNVLDQANTARTQANTARNTANDSYAQANTSYAQANNARDQANTAFAQANDAYAASNTVSGVANLAYAQANSARAAANAAANTVRVSSNSGATLSGKQLNFVNTSTSLVTISDSGDGNANIAITVIGGGAIAQAYDQANAAYAQANAAYGQANTGYGQANAAYLQANTARGTANDAYAQANDAYGQANTGYAQANAAYLQANNAYAAANLKLNTAGGIISGDLEVQGNLFLTGNATYINVATIRANDSMIQLSVNAASDVLDIGFVGHYSDGVSNLHTGFIRHAADDIYYLFDGYGLEPTNNIIDVASANLAWLRANVNAAALLLNGNAVATQANLTLAHNQANAAYGQANTARGTANDAYAQANAAYSQANTGFSQANDAYSQANTGYGQANAAYAQANAAYDRANTKVSKSGDTMTGGLAINTTGYGLSVGNANVAFTLTVGSLNVTTNTVTTSSSGQVVLDKFPIAQLASAKYFVQANSASDYHTTEVVLVQDTTNVWLTEYGSIQTGPSLGSFSADISGGDVRLLFTAVNNINTIRSVRYGITP